MNTDVQSAQVTKFRVVIQHPQSGRSTAAMVAPSVVAEALAGYARDVFQLAGDWSLVARKADDRSFATVNSGETLGAFFERHGFRIDTSHGPDAALQSHVLQLEQVYENAALPRWPSVLGR